jgi:CsoR family transcriptional regulator, copper-sensing transcriptional repressor
MARKASKPGESVGSEAGLASSSGRPAAGVNPEARAAHVKHLRRVKGQVEGIERMVVDGRYCADVIIQITAARASLLSVAKALLAEHLKACHIEAIKNGGADIDDMYQELVDLVGKMAK